ncbi:hypothetical protein O6H91_Y260100 [Diphasiastrum complanatum]|nr:hypothetical protein O6H91_Y260100 [Diphasiastrum complanatum]
MENIDLQNGAEMKTLKENSLAALWARESKKKSELSHTLEMTGLMQFEEDELEKESLEEDIKKYPRNQVFASLPFHKLFYFADGKDYLLMFFGSIGAIVHGAELPVYFFFFGKLLNGFGGHQQNRDQMYHIVSKYALYFVFLGVVSFVASWTEIACWMYTSERQSEKLRIRYLEAMLRQDVGFYDTDAQTGDIIQKLSSDTLLFQDAIGEKMGNFIHYMSMFSVGFILSFTTVWQLAAVMIPIAPIIALGGVLFVHGMSRSTSKSREAYSKAGTIAEQAFSHIRTVYSFVGETEVLRSYSSALQAALKVLYKAGFSKGLTMGATYGLMFFAWAVLLLTAGYLVRHGHTDGGKALTTILNLVVGTRAVGHAFPTLSTFAKARAAGYKIIEMIHKQLPTNKRESNGLQIDNVQGEVEFCSVSFSYPSRPNVPIFTDFSLRIPAAKTVAIVGSSGSGKSTVISLIMRFYDPIKGEVKLDGNNLNLLQVKWLRDQLGLVSQEPALFATSIVDNLLYGKQDARMQEVEEACIAANCHGFITQLPNGYDTQVGQRGIQLSGGQKQRIAIARAMLKSPKVLLLDEATSALDANSEYVVQQALNRVMVGRTTVVVAHRLSTVRNVDTIAVLQQGKIIEVGDHETLISKRETGAYSTLVRLQETANNESTIANRDSRMSSPEYSGSLGRMSPYRSPRKEGKVAQLSGRLSIEDENEKAPEVSVWRIMKLTKPDWPYALLGVCSIVFHALQHYYFGVMGENLTQRVREMMLSAILRNEVSWFDLDENHSSHLASRLSSDATNVKAAIVDRISIIIQNFSMLMTACIISFIVQWQIALLVLATFPFLVIGALAQMLFLNGFAGDVAKAHAKATVVAGEAMSNIRTVLAFNAQEKILFLFNKQLEIVQRRSLLRGQVAGSGFGTSQFAMYATHALCLWFGSLLVRRGHAEFDRVILAFMVVMLSAYGVAQTISLTPDLAKAGQALQSVFQIIDRKTKIEPDDSQSERVHRLKGHIEFKHVEFCYPSRPHVKVFEDLNLKINPGHSLALVGASGSGKSSIISLIERFYDPVAGTVLIDGKNVKKLHLRSLREHIGLVQQEPALFSTTIRANILYGSRNATDTEIVEAAKISNAHGFISSLPQGYETSVGDTGVQLSGGQKQRLAIARAVLKNPRILLLDEATSALDAESEKLVQVALDHLMQGRTTVMIAHRLSTIRNANVIAVVHEGTIIEQGSHRELSSKIDGAYARLINMQKSHH